MDWVRDEQVMRGLVRLVGGGADAAVVAREAGVPLVHVLSVLADDVVPAKSLARLGRAVARLSRV